MEDTYKIIRFYQDSYDRDEVATGLTLEEAKEHCQDEDTSSTTCETPEGLARTESRGNWFEGFESE